MNASAWRWRWRGMATLIGALATFTLPPSLAQSGKPWPTDARLSGNAFLTPSLKDLAQNPDSSPLSLWQDKGQALWTDSTQGRSCQSCHGTVDTLKAAATQFPKLSPKLSADGKQRLDLINLEDQIVHCRSRAGQPVAGLESDDVLALSALLHSAAKGLPIDVKSPVAPDEQAPWQAHLSNGAKAYATRIGRLNLACVHCHDQSIGKQLRADVISPGNPTGFPVYRISWQTLGSIDRRLRACYSGVQAQVPPAGDPVLRELELYLKVRAAGLAIEGPSLRR